MTADLVAGRELDERVARAMWPDNPLIRAAEPWLRPFSTDTAAAMTLLDTLAARGSYHRLGV